MHWTSLVAGGTYANISIAIPASGIISGNFSSTGYLTISAPVSFTNTNIYFSENAVVNQNSKTTIDRSYWHGCTSNWQGIKSNQLFNVTNSVIEDAGIGIQINTSSATHPGLVVDNTIFNVNVYGMLVTGNQLASYKVTGSIFTTRNIPPANYVYTTGNRWTSLSTFNNTTLAGYPIGYLKGSSVMGLPSTARGQIGLYFGSAAITSTAASQYITIGDASSTPTTNASFTNVFDNLRIGEYNSGSKTTLYNNYFQYIASMPASDLYSNASACAFNSSAPDAIIGSNATGGAAAIYKNTFYNSLNGVYATINGTLSVTNNQFTGVTQYGTWVENWNAGSSNTATVQINNNVFTTCLYDLYTFNNTAIKLNFTNNSATYPLTPLHGAVTYHAYINEVSKPTTALYNISYNNAVGKVIGVYCTNAYSPSVTNNTLTVRTPNGFNAPVWFDNTDAGEVIYNTLNASPSNSHNTSVFGIFTSVGNNNLYCNNLITGVSTAMKFQGTSPSRIYLNSLNANPADPCYFGIMLDASGFVGPIKYSSSCAMNTFGDFDYAGGGSDTYSQGSSIGSNIDYPGINSSSNQYCPFTNLNFLPASAFVSVSNTSSNSAVCINQPLQFMTMQQLSTSPSTLSAGLPVIMNNALNFTSNNANSKAIAAKSTYELMRKSATNASTISGASNFMNANSANANGSFYVIDSLVAQYAVTNNTATLNQAKNLNTALSPVGNIETNQRNFNAVYHLFMKDESLITSAHLNVLKNIAVLCPYTDGTNVYQARALLKHFDTTVYYNACEQTLPNLNMGNSRIMGTNTELNSSKEALLTLVYPNPAGNEITVSTDVDGAKLLIFNVMGQVVLQSELSTLTKLNVSDLKTGTYIYKIVKGNQIIKADKLIINK